MARTFRVDDSDVREAREMACKLTREMGYVTNMPDQLSALAAALGAVNGRLRLMMEHGYRGEADVPAEQRKHPLT